MKSLQESLFDKDLVSSTPVSLYDLFGKHIKKFQYSLGHRWTTFFSQKMTVREWKKEGSPELSGGFSKTTFPPDLQKLIAVILKNTVVFKDELLKSSDGEIDCKGLNDKLKKSDIIWPKDTMWGNTKVGGTEIKMQISYIEGIPAGPDHGVELKKVGVKHFKGFNTDKIELCIYAYDPDHSGFVWNGWVLLTDVSINDLKK